MQLPFLAHILGVNNFTLVPIMVGSLDAKAEEHYGKLLAKYFDMDDVIFVASTDFCHWGQK
jgi:AmmeMemoRadiSam system protein B